MIINSIYGLTSKSRRKTHSNGKPFREDLSTEKKMIFAERKEGGFQILVLLNFDIHLEIPYLFRKDYFREKEREREKVEKSRVTIQKRNEWGEKI